MQPLRPLSRPHHRYAFAGSLRRMAESLPAAAAEPVAVRRPSRWSSTPAPAIAPDARVVPEQRQHPRSFLRVRKVCKGNEERPADHAVGIGAAASGRDVDVQCKPAVHALTRWPPLYVLRTDNSATGTSKSPAPESPMSPVQCPSVGPRRRDPREELSGAAAARGVTGVTTRTRRRTRRCGRSTASSGSSRLAST
jgi:hypothetical protein